MLEVQEINGKIFAPLKKKWLDSKPEEMVRQKYICRLVNDYGFELSQMDQERLVTNSQRGTGAARADIVIWRSEEDKINGKYALIVVECKAENVTIHEDDYYQGYNYAVWCGADFFVTTNLKETRVFKVVKGEIPNKLDEIVDIPSAEKANNQKEIDAILMQTKAFSREDFSKLLRKCHNIIRNNDKLSPEAAFDEISKLLFIKIRFERDNSGVQIFSAEEFKKAKNSYNKYKPSEGEEFYQFLFSQTKKDFKKDYLFDDNAKIEIRENSFEQIVKELQIYNLSTTSDDVKGIAFEKFLGHTFRGELGQFFTPRTIVDFMVNILDPQEGEYICDPCCGSGGFLIRAFEYVRDKIERDIEQQKANLKSVLLEGYDSKKKKDQEAVDKQIEKAFSRLNEELNINNDKGRLRTLSFDCIYGTDANPRMARTAKMNMIMHGDGHGGVHHHDGLLNVNGIFENRFDVILTNPPFGARVDKDMRISNADRFTDDDLIAGYMQRYGQQYRVALQQVNDNIGKPLLDLYKTSAFSALTETLFLERCLNLLKPGGRMGIVLPEGVLNNSDLQRFREYVEGKAKILLIVSIPSEVFKASGATIKPSLMFFKKFTLDEEESYRIIKQKTRQEIIEKYPEMQEIEAKLALRGKDAPSKDEKKHLRAEKKRLKSIIENEIIQTVKERFDYEIPIAEVEKAGINSIGAKIENELIPLEKEFSKYRIDNALWSLPNKEMKYEFSSDGKMFRTRISDGLVGEPEIFYGKDSII
ncbi:MAG: N-6 DNA methylase [Muribaculaceae bacterium]|nr:N-6 DNA methylase [Muribaculaceae bacterium]